VCVTAVCGSEAHGSQGECRAEAEEQNGCRGRGDHVGPRPSGGPGEEGQGYNYITSKRRCVGQVPVEHSRLAPYLTGRGEGELGGVWWGM